MLFTVDQLQRYRYKITQCVVRLGNTATTVNPMSVTGMYVDDSYLTNAFPIFRINLVCDDDIYYSISQNKSSVRIHLTIMKYFVTEDKNGEVDKKSSYLKWIDDDFALIPDELDVKKDTDIDRLEDLSGADDTKESMNEWKNSMELYLYRVEVANGLKKILNAQLQNTTLTSAITWALSESGIRNCIMSPLENGKRYEKLFIPPLPINKLLLHLDAMYGFYRCGSMIYFGLKRSYILNYRGGCTAYERGERTETCFLTPQITSFVSSTDGGTVEKGDQKNYIYWDYLSMDFHNPSMVENVLVGNDALVINTSSGTISSAKSKSVVNNGVANTAIINNDTQNPWMDITYAVQSSSRSNVVRGAISNADLDALTPNKLFTLVVEDPHQTNACKGQYKLVSALHKFINDSGTGDFSVVSGIEIRKMETVSIPSSVSMT